jgi:hypothetical protein
MATPSDLQRNQPPRMVLRIAPTRTARAAKIYDKCRRRFAYINPFLSGNRLELLNLSC